MAMDSEKDKLQKNLDDMRRRLQEERVAAESLTRHFATQHEQGYSGEQSRVKKVELELTVAKKQLADQKESAEKIFHQLTAERDTSWAQVRDLETNHRSLSQDLEETRRQIQDQREASERLIAQLIAERNELQKFRSEADSKALEFEEKLSAVQQEVEQKRAAEELVRQMTAERDESRSHLAEIESRTQALEEDMASAQNLFREQREAAVRLIQQLESERDEYKAQVNDLEAGTQILQEELAASREQLQMKEAAAQAPPELPASPARPPLWLPNWEGVKQADEANAGSNGNSELESAPNADPVDAYWRTAMSISLLLISSDLLAMNMKKDADAISRVREIQSQTQRLLERLHNSIGAKPQTDAEKQEDSGKQEAMEG